MSDFDAFLSVDFGWTRGLRSVWIDPGDHVAPLHAACIDGILAYFKRSTREAAPVNEPLGRVVVGPAGSGKTHLVGELRRRVWEMDGWFVLVDLIGVKDFWASTALSFFNSLQAVRPGGETQHRRLLYKLSDHLRIEAAMQEIVERRKREPHALVIDLAALFIDALTARYRRDADVHRDVVTALILLLSPSSDVRDIAHYWLQGQNIDDSEEARRFGFRRDNEPIKVVEGLSWIMSLVGPTMIAIDQIDAIVSASHAEAAVAQARAAASAQAVEAILERAEAQSIVDALAQGLMDLHERKRRAVTVIACLETTWAILQDKSAASVTDRYKEPAPLRDLQQGETARELVAQRLALHYGRDAFVPPHPTWPFSEQAFATAVGFSPRRLLKACDAHQRRCEALGRVESCESFLDSVAAPPEPKNDAIEQEFVALCRAAQIDDLGDEAKIAALFDAVLPLYEAHLTLPDHIDVEAHRDPDQRSPSLHGRLKFVFHAENDREQHYCFLGLFKTHATAFQARLRAAMTASGVDRALKFRHLYILRSSPAPSGAQTAKLVAQFEQAGGRFLAPQEADLRIFAALRTLAGRKPAKFEAWLRARRPLFETELFKTAGLCPPSFLSQPVPEAGVAPAQPSESAAPKASPVIEPQVNGADIPVGRRWSNRGEGESVSLAASLLPRHVAIFAGAGSGKTVLLRRIVEEAALLGFPAIVLDANNDLSRLGDPWPSPPGDFSEADAAKAANYHRQAEVVLWTPGAAAGNPLSLRLLPDFSAIGDASDERDQAVEMARATLEPYLGTGSGRKARLNQGVLADALRLFAKGGGGDLDALIDLLADLPDGASAIDDAGKLAADLSNMLRAAVATEPLLRTQGPPIDPGALYAGANGRTRVSVINLAALASEGARQAFVNQLQMALFGWIKQHPSATPRLYALDEAQIFAPSQKGAACKESTKSLVAQSRKYGLGMVFATQLPKGIDNAIVSNCTTHVYGKMNSPATIQAVHELMEAKGGGGDDIARLSRGEFYFSTEGVGRPIKIRTPLCLSFHPANPPTAEEIVAKARMGRALSAV